MSRPASRLPHPAWSRWDGAARRPSASPVSVTVELTFDGGDALGVAAQLAGALPDLVTSWIAASGGGSTCRVGVGTRVALPLSVVRPATRAPATGAQSTTPTTPTTPTVRLYPARRTASAGGSTLALTRREFDLLLFLAEHPGRVFTRTQLLMRVWGQRIVSGERTVDVHIRRIRAKLGAERDAVTTVRGVGYRLDGLGRISVVREAA